MNKHIEELLKSWSDKDRGTFDKRGLVLMLKKYNELIKIKELLHYYDTTVGMFATDRPDLVDDSIHRVLFELEEIEGIKIITSVTDEASSNTSKLEVLKS